MILERATPKERREAAAIQLFCSLAVGTLIYVVINAWTSTKMGVQFVPIFVLLLTLSAVLRPSTAQNNRIIAGLIWRRIGAK